MFAMLLSSSVENFLFIYLYFVIYSLSWRKCIQDAINFQNTKLAYMEPILSQIYK